MSMRDDGKKLNYKYLRKPGVIWQKREVGSHLFFLFFYFLINYELTDEVLKVPVKYSYSRSNDYKGVCCQD